MARERKRATGYLAANNNDYGQVLSANRKWRWWTSVEVEGKVFWFVDFATTASRAATFLFRGSLSMQSPVRRARDRWDRSEGGRKVRGQDSRRIESFGTRRWIIGIQTGDSVLRTDSQPVAAPLLPLERICPRKDQRCGAWQFWRAV